MKHSNRQEALECACPLGSFESLPSREFGAPAAALINTVALARCPGARRTGELFQQFVCRRRKPLKRLDARTSCFHRAKAAVLMRGAAAAGGPAGLGGPALHFRIVASRREAGLWKAIAPSGRAKLRRSDMFIARVPRLNQAPLGAACRPTSARRPAMPLLTELKTSFLGSGDYKHAAPDGALAFANGFGLPPLGKRVRVRRDSANNPAPPSSNKPTAPHD